MKILYLASRFDYGDPRRGLSFEHYNFFDTFYNTGNEIIYFDHIDIQRKSGKRNMNKRLYDLFQEERPDLVFVFPFENELKPDIMDKISGSGNSLTLGWFADDHWRFSNYSRYWAPRFNWSVTTDINSVEKYRSTGYINVIHSQWGCNHFRYDHLDLKMLYDVSFVGQKYGNREQLIEMICNLQKEVYTRGHGWPLGRVTQDEMIRIFNQSKINLNLAKASMNVGPGWLSRPDRFMLYTPVLRRLWKKVRPFLLSVEPPPLHQIKGRNFEIPGCGGFLLTDYVPGLEEYYEIGKEIVCYTDARDMMEKLEYYVNNEKQRREIARRGYTATQARHTYVHRFNEIFKKMGLDHTFSLEKNKGTVRYISEEVLDK